MEFLSKIHRERTSYKRKRSIKVLPPIERKVGKMTTTIATTTIGLPKNKTGLFAADTLQEVKPTKNSPVTIPTSSSHHRHIGSANQSERTRSSKYGSSYQSDHNRGLTNEFYLTANGIRDGFRPSSIRRQKLRITTAMSHRDNNDRESKDSPSKGSFAPSPASARIKSEIDQINSRLKIHRDLQKLLQSDNNHDINDTPQSSLSYSTSYRLSSASTNPTTARIQKRFSSTINNGTLNTLTSIDTSNKSLQSLSGIAASTSSPINEEDNNQQDITHTYQIPQQSTIGGESIFPVNSHTSPSIKTSKTKVNRRFSGKTKPVSCPFYVMYFTNLAIQQQDNDNKTPRSITPRTVSRKGTVNSRISTSHPRSQSSRRQLHSPISMNTYSTLDDDDSMINSTTYYNNKRFSAKIAAFEHENTTLLKDILRTTSWNHLQA